MAIPTHPTLRALGLFWKKEDRATGRYRSFEQLNGRSYSLIHRDSQACVLFTGFDQESQTYRFYKVVPRAPNRRSKVAYSSHEDAMVAAENFAVANLGMIRQLLGITAAPIQTTAVMLNYLSVKLGTEQLHAEMARLRTPDGTSIMRSSAAVIQELYELHQQHEALTLKGN